MARRLAIKKAPWKNAANQLVCVIFYGGWLGRPDLNRRMEESKSSALPLGDGPAKEKTAQHNHCAVFGGVPREIRTLGLQSHNLAR